MTAAEKGALLKRMIMVRCASSLSSLVADLFVLRLIVVLRMFDPEAGCVQR